MEAQLYNFLIQQAPVVAIMAIGCYFGFRYMNKQVMTYQAIVERKDDEIKMLNKEAKEDLLKGFTVLQDVNGTMQQWLLKTEQNDSNNEDTRAFLKESIASMKLMTESILNKLNK